MKISKFMKATAMLLFFPFAIQSQSIHEQELNYYNSLGNAEANYYEANTPIVSMPPKEKANCNLNKVVYGWHPYWMGNAYQNYDWDLLSHMSFFSYEVDAATGNPNNTHGWSTSAAVTAALASGNTKVTLCVTLFSGHNTFFGSASAQQTLITNLINLVSSRGAHGVQIDFEGLPSGQKTNFANWMVSLSNQMKAAIPGSEVSTVLYAVDWNDVFDFSIMANAIDHFIIMGYDYYWTGSTNAGPNDPLFHFGSTYNYNLSRSITYYLNIGCPKDKLVLGLPYYGREWPTSSTNVPSSTTGNGTSRTYSVVKNNSSGYYSQANHQFQGDSFTDIFIFNNGGTRQCFITLEDGFRKRLEHINTTGIAGMGIWALGYDNGYSELWQGIEDYMTDCQADACTGTIHDFGGPTKNYYNNEDYTWTINPPGSSAITFNFTEFNVELNYDYLYIYDGADINAPQIAGSPFTGTNSPGTFTSSTGAVTFRWTSDGATVAPGFIADWTCNQDITPPSTVVTTPNNWQTQDFTVNFVDTDNEGVEKSFYNVTDFDGTEWRSNDANGFFFDAFSQTAIHTDWTNSVGTWNIVNGALHQTDEVANNSNLYADLTQDNNQAYLYHWKGEIGGSGSNRRAGIHFFCDDATLDQRGNSYMVYWRADNNKCQIYKSVGNSITIYTDDVVNVDANTEYDFKILFDPSTGLIQAFLDDVLVSSWADPNPLQSANSISLRTGNCSATYDDFTVYKSRNTSSLVSIGNSNADIRYQNPNPLTPSGNVKSIVIDEANNWSNVVPLLVDVDWTVASSVTVNDGLSTDIDIFNINTEISGNWTTATDTHSDVVLYEYAVGDAPGLTNVINWTSNGTATSFTATGLNLVYNTTYYVSVRTTNGAGLVTSIVTSDGQLLENPTQVPVAGFSTPNNTVCEGDSIQLVNSSQHATSYLWSVTGGILSNNTANNPYVTFPNSGTYNVTLVASGPGGTDQLSQNITVTITPGPDAAATINNTVVYLPNAIVSFTNNSTDADSYFWDFADGNTSTDANPWNLYGAVGTYDIMLVAMSNGCANDTTYFSVEVLEESDVNVSEQVFENVTVYPNPFEGNIILKGLSGIHSEVTISLVDMSGRVVYLSSKIDAKDFIEINGLNNISKGVYQLILSTENENRTFKLVK